MTIFTRATGLYPVMRTIRNAGLGLAVIAGLAFGGAGLSNPAYGEVSQAQKIADHFSSVKSMTGEFVQFGPRGEQTGGTFALARPGKIRFDYESPAAFKVVSDGVHVLLNNQKLRTYETYPLSKTPLKLLLDEHIDLGKIGLENVKADADLVTIGMSDKSVFGNSKITMMFDTTSSELRQWTITDAQGKDTTVMIFNIKEGAPVKASDFKIDYDKVAETNSRGTRGR